MTPGLLKTDQSAEKFNGLPAGVGKHGQLLAAFKSAAPRLGISPRLVHAVDYLFKFTFPQDWDETSRPIVWPSALEQQLDLGLSPSQVKETNRRLAELGLVTMKDSPNGKRYGRRFPNDQTGRIVEAYGFDLSLFAARHAEFVRLAQEEKAERRALGRLKRRRTIAHKGIIQILETAEEYGFDGDEWPTLSRETRDIVRALKNVERLDEMEAGVASLERRWHAARERINQLLQAVNTGPMGPENRPYYYNYNPTKNLQEDTVIAAKGCSGVPEPPSLHPPASGDSEKPGQGRPSSPRTDRGMVHGISASEVVQLAPRLKGFLRHPNPTWPEIVDAADWIRTELGISKPAWNQACLAMGRDLAAIAIAIISAKEPGEIRNPGGYLRGMLAKHIAGELHLERTIWALRRVLDPGRYDQHPRSRPAAHGGPEV
jgi:replication initiation protein RepC